MIFIKTDIEGLLLLEPKIFRDSRGFFFESYSSRVFASNGIDIEFVQDNQSRSVKGTLRGMHFQATRPQDKLVRVISGEILDVAVDLRPDSPSFGKHSSFILSSENARQLLVPKGFAHGFCVLSEYAEMCYKCSDFYFPELEKGIIWNDVDMNISWPIRNPLVSGKDATNKLFKQFDFSLYSRGSGYIVEEKL